MLDIDYFKNINDTYGHDIGDNALKEFATLLKKQSRNIDIMGRYGGEEFLVFLHKADKEGTVKVAETIRKRFQEKRITVESKEIPHSVSIGVTHYPADDLETMNGAIKRADSALYQAKREGRNRVVIFRDEKG